MEEAERHFAINARTDQWHMTTEEMELSVHTTGVPAACMDLLLTNGHGRQFRLNSWTEVAQPPELLLQKANPDINRDIMSSKGCISIVKAKPGFDKVSVFDEYFCRKGEQYILTLGLVVYQMTTWFRDWQQSYLRVWSKFLLVHSASRTLISPKTGVIPTAKSFRLS